MTIDEAIAHAKEVAKEKREELKNAWEFACESRSVRPYQEELEECKKCVEEHEQIAEWLEDYKKIKEQIAFVSSKPIEELCAEYYNKCIDAIKQLKE